MAGGRFVQVFSISRKKRKESQDDVVCKHSESDHLDWMKENASVHTEIETADDNLYGRDIQQMQTLLSVYMRMYQICFLFSVLRSRPFPIDGIEEEDEDDESRLSQETKQKRISL